MFTVICQVVQETVLFFDLRLLLFAFFLLRTFQLFLHRSVFFHHHSVSKILWRSYSEDPIPIFFGKVKAILEPTFWAVFLVFQTSCCPKPTFAINVNLTTLPQPFSNIALPCVRLPPSLCSQGFISSFMITCSGDGHLHPGQRDGGLHSVRLCLLLQEGQWDGPLHPGQRDGGLHSVQLCLLLRQGQWDGPLHPGQRDGGLHSVQLCLLLRRWQLKDLHLRHGELNGGLHHKWSNLWRRGYPKSRKSTWFWISICQMVGSLFQDIMLHHVWKLRIYETDQL